jgi:hypothetical protein
MNLTRLLITSAAGALLACTAAHAAPAAAASAPVAAPGAVATLGNVLALRSPAPSARVAPAPDSVAAVLARVGNISEGW